MSYDLDDLDLPDHSAGKWSRRRRNIKSHAIGECNLYWLLSFGNHFGYVQSLLPDVLPNKPGVFTSIDLTLSNPILPKAQ
jgi:hypothetical protein